MKKIILSCIIGLTLLSAANASAIKRYVTIFIEGYVLYANSDATSGKITRVDVYDADMQELLITHPCGGAMSCQVDLHGLPAGNYEAQAVCSKGSQLKAFSL